MSVSRDLEPDAIGPWAILVGEGVTGSRPVISAYGPMPRSAAEATLERLDLCAFDDGALVPFPNSIEVEGLTTVVTVAFGA